jgi:hypothetical protein
VTTPKEGGVRLAAWGGGRMRGFKLIFYVICILAFSASPLKAQYQGYQFLGLDGLKAGSQPSQGYYLTMPLYYGWYGISIYGPQGNLVLKDAISDTHMLVLPNFEVGFRPDSCGNREGVFS